MATNETFTCISSLFGFQFHDGFDKKRELKVVKSILRRETILMNLTHLFFSSDAYNKGTEILDVLMQLRISSLKTIEAIVEWRTSFLGYHEKDLDFLSENVTFTQLLGLPPSNLVRNPLMLSNTLEEVDTTDPVERASRDCDGRTDSSYYEERLRIRKAERVLLVEMECNPKSAGMVASLTTDEDDEDAGGIFGLTEAGRGGAKKVQQLREEVSLATFSEDVKITPEILISCVNASLPPKRLQLAGASCLMLATEGLEIPSDLAWQTFCREVTKSGAENFAEHLNGLSPQSISQVKAMAMKPFIRLLTTSKQSGVSDYSELERAIDVLSRWVVQMLYRSGDNEILPEPGRPLTRQGDSARPSSMGASGDKNKCHPSSRSASSVRRSSRTTHVLAQLQYVSVEPSAAVLDKGTDKGPKPLLPLPRRCTPSRLSEPAPLRSVDDLTLPRKPVKVQKRGHPFHTELVDDLIEGRPGPVVLTLLSFKLTDRGVADEATSGSFLAKADMIVIKAYETATSREASLEVAIKDFVSVSNVSEGALGSFAPNDTAWWADNIRDIIVIKESMSGHLSLTLNKAVVRRKSVVKALGLATPKPLLAVSSKLGAKAAVEPLLQAKVRRNASPPKASPNELATLSPKPLTTLSPKSLTQPSPKSSAKPKSAGKPKASSPLPRTTQLKDIAQTGDVKAAEAIAAASSKEDKMSSKFSECVLAIDNAGLLAEDVRKETVESTEEMKQPAVWTEAFTPNEGTVANAAVAPIALECSISPREEEYAAYYSSDLDEMFVQSPEERNSVSPQVATAKEAASFSSKDVAKQEEESFSDARFNSMTQKNELAAQMDTGTNEDFNEIDYYEDDYGAEESAEADAIISEAVGDVLSHVATGDALDGDYSSANVMVQVDSEATKDALVSSLYGVKHCDADELLTSSIANNNGSNQHNEKDQKEEDEEVEASYGEDFDE